MTDMKARFGLIVRLPILLAALAGGAAPVGALERVADLYRGQTVVTGQENLPERARGIRETLVEVLVKASGDARLKGDIRLPTLLANAEGLVATLDYEDRHGNKPINHEQGTRDRSFILRVRFDEAKVASALASLGRKPWTAERPRLLVLLAVRDARGGYVVAETGDRGNGQREVLRSVAARRGLPIAVPKADLLERSRLRYADLATQAPANLPDRDALLGATGADAILIGVKTITPRGYWDTTWTLDFGGRRASWRIADQTFDRAIENGLETAARHLAGIDR